MPSLEDFYNKFNEEKRLLSRRGQVEYITTMKYIHDFLNQYTNPTIMEIGAATGRYCCALANEGYDVSAVELTKTNLGRLKAKKTTVKAYLGNAIDLSFIKDEQFDVTLVLGPMYHLPMVEDQLKALAEAKRITKTGGTIIVAYIMNEFAILQHGFIDGHILEGNYDETFKTIATKEDLYNQMRIEDIDKLNEAIGLKRIKIVSADGPATYIRQTLNSMDEASFQKFIEYHLATCERMDLIGACNHTIDILRK